MNKKGNLMTIVIVFVVVLAIAIIVIVLNSGGLKDIQDSTKTCPGTCIYPDESNPPSCGPGTGKSFTAKCKNDGRGIEGICCIKLQ
tara:strand:+ start:1479 stop:1736 length:258 start_codon:yes stop_codon:yes gene_type:complete